MKKRILFDEVAVTKDDGYGNGEECRVELARYPPDGHGYAVAVLHMEHGRWNGHGGLKFGSIVERKLIDADSAMTDAALIREAIEEFDTFVGKFRE